MNCVTSTSLLLFRLILVIIFSGCFKKGDDDPFVSLRTREGRMAGEWTVSNFQSTFTQDTIVVEWNFSGQKMSMGKHTVNGDSISFDEYPYSSVLSIGKKGSFGWNQYKYHDKFSVYGYWYFGNRNKIGDIKNKETISLILSQRDYNFFDGSHSHFKYKGWETGMTYFIKKLTGKEMVLHREYSGYDDDGIYFTVSEQIEFIKRENNFQKLISFIDSCYPPLTYRPSVPYFDKIPPPMGG